MRTRTGTAILAGAASVLLTTTLTVGTTESTPQSATDKPAVSKMSQHRSGHWRCVARADGRRVRLTAEQAENASLIATAARRRGLPTSAAIDALAASYDQSGLRNIRVGKGDGRGLFRQSASEGWGTAQRIGDRNYAINAYYDVLSRVKKLGATPVTGAARKVKRADLPGSPAKLRADARTLSASLLGSSRGSFTCNVDKEFLKASPRLTAIGLVPRARAVLWDLERHFGPQMVGGFEPRGVNSGHMEGSAHYEGRAVDIFFRPINPVNKLRGWAMAHYLVAHAERLGVSTVIFDAKIWTAEKSDEGWRHYTPQSDIGDRKILEHRDHVHVDVFE
ncbi:hypothetical protein [Nocardioides sp. zg-DK7169]|uniref:hypothetical protein n=1 Tax=Nocardioides sp. zg-DK7169 TaxID=2736600 RepID=UPI00155603FF|nr:hypothetical protein [Nocardioides sp. zg-DK7169]NPC95846.1 hypothetical protein [Nocardioides sp. zg-DK7169]